MLARFRIEWESLRSSLWAVPLTMACFGAALSFIAVHVRLPEGVELAWIYGGSSASARQFAASLVSAMITLTALSFSITMVVLTLAAQQLGPRLIQAFMSDRKTQLALGLFLGTVVYLVLVLRTIDGSDGTTGAGLAITTGTALVLASVVVLLLFVHWLARSIVSDNVIARVAAAFDNEIDAAARDDPTSPRPAETELPPGGEPLTLGVGGYVLNVDHAALVRIAREAGFVLVLERRAGDHLLPQEAIGRVRGTCSEASRDAIADAIVVGPRRTPGQDPEWSVRQLVEVALRALSSGINDEYTAGAVIDRIAQSLARMAALPLPRSVWLDEDGEPRLLVPAAGFSEIAHTALDPIRAAARGNGRTLLHLARTVARLWPHTPSPHRPALARQGELILGTARATLFESAELDSIERAISGLRHEERAPVPR